MPQLTTTPIFLLIFLMFWSYEVRSDSPVITIMFYNVENLFDTVEDPITADNEFLPAGERRWTNARFRQKLTNIARVFNNTGFWEPPSVIGLCEVENRYVLEELVNHPAIKKWNYQIIHKDSPDSRGIDVAALYRPDQFVPLSYRYFPPVDPEGDTPDTREILYLSGILAGLDTLHLYFNHWPSRYGGLMETRHTRERAAARLRHEFDRLQEIFREPRVVIMGDFNDQPVDRSLHDVLMAQTVHGNEPGLLYNLSQQWAENGKGTLKYQGFWNTFDQIIVSGVLFNPDAPLFCLPADALIVEAKFLFLPDERYTGQKLNRTYEGFRYTGGYSDHLPVLLKLRNR